MKKIAWKVVIITIVVLVISAYFLSSWIPSFPVYYKSLTNWFEKRSTPTTEERREKRRAILENLPKPKLTGKEVAYLLRKEQTIKNQELYDMADWYVYHGDRDVIRQVFANRQFEMKSISNDKDNDDYSISTDYILAGIFLGPSWGTDFERLIQRQEIHKFSTNKKIAPHFIYYLLNRSLDFKTSEYRNYYGHLLFYDDILAYLRIYVNYKDYPAIESLCKSRIIEYPCGWRDRYTIQEVLKIAEEKGVETAYELYMQRYQGNYQRFSASIRDHSDWKKRYEYESIFRGWSSENIWVEMRVHDVDSNKAAIDIKHVEKITSVLRDGEDITHLCHITTENIMTIPLKAAEVIELKYRVNVCPLWWDYYHAKPLKETTYAQFE